MSLFLLFNLRNLLYLIGIFYLAGPGGLAFFHLTKKKVSQWQMKK